MAGTYEILKRGFALCLLFEMRASIPVTNDCHAWASEPMRWVPAGFPGQQTDPRPAVDLDCGECNLMIRLSSRTSGGLVSFALRMSDAS